MTSDDAILSGDPWYLRFHDLMPYRVREILLVSSPYDAFTLEEDGRLTARLFMEYSELNLSQAPRITHAPTAARAMELLGQRWFDLVITMVHLEDMDVGAFAQQVKEQFPDKPVVLLSFSESELSEFQQRGNPAGIDRVFLWTGDTGILIAAIKSIEDSINADHDTRTARVRVIIVIEDTVRHYSAFLSMLFAELLTHAGSLIAEGVNPIHKLMRLRARPKILHATTFEEARSLYRRYRPYVVAVISDVRFPKGGIEEGEAGIDLARMIREEDPDIPILLQSADPGLPAKVADLHVSTADKNSPHLLRQVRGFLVEGLGFGDFIFRMPDRSEVRRVRDVYEMEKVLPTVPAASLQYHASRHHFALWLMARSMFRLGEGLRHRGIEDFDGIEGVRQHLISVLRQARVQDQEGAITDFSAHRSETQGSFVRMGGGSIGGKGRGVAFVNSLLVRHGVLDRFAGLGLRVPRTMVIGTDVYDQFVEQTGIVEDARRMPDEEILRRFLDERLPEDLLHDLELARRKMTGPLAVRSSSLLEDSHLQPFAGIYATYMLPNNDPDPSVCLRDLCQAIKAVYASTLFKGARSYISGTPYSMEDEKMGVVIMELVGQRYGPRFYPHFSGVARSYNFYPVGDQRSDEGIAAVALGLGHTVVSGGAAVQFSPAKPQILPQFPSARDFVARSQTTFWALDLSRTTLDFGAPPESSLIACDLSLAEEDGTLAPIGSVYSTADDTIRDTLNQQGPRVVTFNNILKWEAVPIANALVELLKMMRQGVGQPVEIEFAVDLGDYGRRVQEGNPRREPCLYVLQVRPQAVHVHGPEVDLGEVEEERVLVRSKQSLGHGVRDDIQDVVYVKLEALETVSTAEAAVQLGRLNGRLMAAGRPYMLVGPGRWGSSDPRLGVPVEWDQIAGAGVIVEAGFADRGVEPSQGSHFFHNITASRVGYLTLPVPCSGGRNGEIVFDRSWLDQLPAENETSAVRHVRLERPLLIYLDGRTGLGAVLKWARPEVEAD